MPFSPRGSHLLCVCAVVCMLAALGCGSSTSDSRSTNTDSAAATTVDSEKVGSTPNQAALSDSLETASESGHDGSGMLDSSASPSAKLDTSDIDCPVDPTEDNLYAMVRDSTGIEFVSDPGNASLSPNPPTSGNWINQDINDDERPDIGIQAGRGSLYERPYELYANCGGGWYVQVFSEDTRKVRLADPDSTVPPDSPASVPARYAETESGQRWRQLVYLTPGSRRVDSKRRVYRMYEDLGRYAMVPGSAWFAGEVPYSKSEMERAGGSHPDCPAGEDTPRIIKNKIRDRAIWKGDLNGDKNKDLILKGRDVEGGTYYLYSIYIKCSGLWYVDVGGGGATKINVGDHKEYSEWREIQVYRKYKKSESEYKIKYKRLEYVRSDAD